MKHGILFQHRTPLNGIIALTEILLSELEGVVAEDCLKNLEIINVSGNRLNNMVTNLLDASLINEKKLNIRPVFFPPVFPLKFRFTQLL